MRFSLVFMSIALCSALFLSACAPSAPAANAPAGDAAATSAPTATADAHAGHGDMAMDSDVPFEAVFLDSMIVHHQGALDMAKLAIEQSERQEIITLSEAILATQEAEIEKMQTWRSEWYPDLAPTEGMEMEMGDMEISDDESKPFDQRFIEAMISHHEGAIAMAQSVLEQSEREELRTLAQAIIEAQEAEIEQMQQWLDEWF
jgi:uncharacterized protein (DUF305 family)